MATQLCPMKTLGAAMMAFLSLTLVIPYIFPSISAAAPPSLPFVIRNHTVGGAAGWSFNNNTNTTALNYSDWAASETFYVGDFLMFNTDIICMVVETNNETMYSLCDSMNLDGDQTIVWSNDWDDTNSSTPEGRDFVIPLSYEGPNYFFSKDMDGEQCRMGMKFAINVLHGQPPPSAYPAPPPPSSEDGGGTSPGSKKNGVEVMRGRMDWAGMGILSLILMVM